MGRRRRSPPPPPRAAGTADGAPGGGSSARRAFLAGVVLLALALASLLALRRPRLVRQSGLNVLLVTIDTLRADALGCYGRAGAETPRVDRLAAGGVRFTFAHAHSVVTLPSHANILTGRYPFDHGVRDNSGFRLKPGIETLGSLLRGAGYRTAAFVSAFPLDSRFGLGNGFEVYDDRLGGEGARADFEMQERPGTATVAAARAWIDSAARPWFCWVHLYEPHAPYRPPFEWRGRVPSAYDGEVTAADAALGPLLDPLLAKGVDSGTLVVLTSDHGEGLGEHGEATHGVFTYESTLRVPLILHGPRLFAHRVVEEPARHVDIVPTVLDALGLPLPATLPGRSLLGIAEGASGGDAPPSYFEALTPAFTRGWAPAYGVLRARVKYIDLPLPELFDLASDPGERTNLVARAAARSDEARALLVRLRSTARGVERDSESTEVRERLAGLGYVAAGGGLKPRYGETDDPKRNVGFENDLEAVIDRYVQGDLRGALARCEDLVRRHPRVPLGLRHLSFLRRKAGDVSGAIEAARRAIQVDVGSAESAAELAQLLNDAGRPLETVALLTPRVQAPSVDLDLLLAYGVALARAGRRDEALAALRRARGSYPSSALAADSLGTALLMFGEPHAAREELQAALRLDPALARAYGQLGVLAAAGGDSVEAVRLWTRTLELDPHDVDSRLNLGTLLWREGRRDEAIPHFRRFLSDAPPAGYAEDVARVRALLAAR